MRKSASIFLYRVLKSLRAGKERLGAETHSEKQGTVLLVSGLYLSPALQAGIERHGVP